LNIDYQNLIQNFIALC